MNGGTLAHPMQGRQQVSNEGLQFDEAAFEKAFAQVDQDMAEHATENSTLDDYQLQLMLLEQQSKKRAMMAKQERDSHTNMPTEEHRPAGLSMKEAQSMSAQRDIRGEQYALLEGEVQSNVSQQEQGRQAEDDAITDDSVLLRIREQRPGKLYSPTYSHLL